MSDLNINSSKQILVRHPANAIQNDYIYMTIPLFVVAVYMYGARVLVLALFAVIAAELCDRIVTAIRKIPYDKTENSSKAFALIVTLLLPASVPYYIAAVAVVSTVLIGKWAFGGYGLYIFSPPCVGFSLVAISWPQHIFAYPMPLTNLPLTMENSEILLRSGALDALRAGGLPNVDVFNLVLGNYPASMGVAYVIVLTACFAFLWMRKRVKLDLPLSFLATCFLITYLFPRYSGIGFAAPWHFPMLRLTASLYEMLSGIILFAAVFLINDEVTAPKRQDSRIIYGIFLGVFTMMFRYFGSYNIGMCFAILSTNVVSAPVDRWMSIAFGKYKKHVG